MQIRIITAFCFLRLISACQFDKNKVSVQAVAEIRAPAYPLVTIDPYISAWSFTDNLFDIPVRHWTGKTHSLVGAIRVDGKTFRFLGKEDNPWTPFVPMGKENPWKGNYTIHQPVDGWFRDDFDDSFWEKELASFGCRLLLLIN